VSKKIAKADITLDVLHVAYDQAINNVSDAWSGSAALGYSFTPKLRVVVDTEYLRTLDFERDVRGMLTLLYSFDLPQATKSAPAPTPASPQTQKKTTR
jgi:hypothetical protein